MGRAVRCGIIAVVAAALAVSGCGGERAAGAGTLRVVASFYPLAEVASRVGGNQVTVRNVTPPGAEPHDIELRPNDLSTMRGADFVLYLSHGFQPAVDDAVRALPKGVRVVDALGFTGAPLPSVGGAGEEEETADPHVWLDPQLLSAIADGVADALGDRRPAERERFASAAASYKQELSILDASFRSTLASCARRDLVTSHAAFGYLAVRYGLNQISIAGVSPEEEPMPKRLEEVARLVRERGVTTIYFETLATPEAAETIARSTGTTTAVLNPIEGLTQDEKKAGETYVSLMRKNLDALRRGLGCMPA